MKQRKQYVLRARDGTLVPVSEEIYREYYRLRRNERYQEEKKKKHSVISMDAIGFSVATDVCSASPEKSVEKKWQEGVQNRILSEEWKRLSQWDRRMLRLLYYEQLTLKDTAQILCCSRGKVINHRDKILKDMRERFRKEGIYSSGG